MSAKEPILTKNFICAFLTQFFLALVMYALMTTIGEYVTLMGAGAAIAGMVSGIYVFGGLVSRLCSGRLLEKYGWKTIASLFLFLHFLASCCYFLASNVWLLLLIRFVQGIGFGAAANAVMVIGMSSLPKSRYGEATGFFMLSTSLAVAVGPYAGGIIFDHFGGNGSFLSADIFALLALLSTLLLDKSKILQPGPTQRETVPPTGIRKVIEPSAIPVSLCILFMAFGYAAMVSFYRMYAASENMTKEFSIFFLIYAAVLLVSRPTVGKLQDRFGDNAICYPSFLLQVIGLILLAWNPCIPTIVFCAAAGALGYGTMNSCLNTIINRNVGNDRRPFAATTYWSCSDIGVGLGPLLLGAIVSAFGYHAMYFAAAGLSFLAIPFFRIAKK